MENGENQVRYILYKVNILWAYNGYVYEQSTDSHTGVVKVMYVYNMGKARGMPRTTYGRSNQ